MKEENTSKITHQEAIILYERGLISAKTVLEAYNFDADQEIKRKEDDITQIHPQNLGHKKESPLMIQSTRIEQARRNVEALSKMCGWEKIWEKTGDLLIASIKTNIKVMDEVVDIK